MRYFDGLVSTVKVGVYKPVGGFSWYVGTSVAGLFDGGCRRDCRAAGALSPRVRLCRM